jgi:hypothetical protein
MQEAHSESTIHAYVSVLNFRNGWWGPLAHVSVCFHPSSSKRLEMSDLCRSNTAQARASTPDLPIEFRLYALAAAAAVAGAFVCIVVDLLHG